MYELRSGMTWSNAVENDKEQKELLMYFVFYFDSGYTISIQYVNGDLIPEAVRFLLQATLPRPAVICYQEGTRTQVDALRTDSNIGLLVNYQLIQ